MSRFVGQALGLRRRAARLSLRKTAKAGAIYLSVITTFGCVDAPFTAAISG
jgi:hypothetical protein